MDELPNYPNEALLRRLMDGEPDACLHPRVLPAFDGSKCRNEDDVRRLYPRFEGVCPDCEEHCVVYASFEHYLAGDW